MSKNMHVLSIIAAATGLALAGSAIAQSGEADLQVKQSEQFGEYIVDADGGALYMFTTDTQGQCSSQARSSCEDQCLKIWPSYTIQGEPTVGDQLQEDLVSTFQRADGQTQVTYGGWPLYYFSKDSNANAPQGQDVHGFGGEWYLVAPDGTKIEKKQQQ